MSVLKKVKTLFSLVMVLTMMFSMSTFSVEAASTDGVAHELYYTTYNEKNEIVEEGIIPIVNENGRYTWDGSITLENGWYTAFRQAGPKAFYATSGTSMTFSYQLDRIAKIKYTFYQDSTPDTLYPTSWKSGTKTTSGTAITYTTDKNAYYYVGVTNASSDTIKISNVSFVF